MVFIGAVPIILWISCGEISRFYKPFIYIKMSSKEITRKLHSCFGAYTRRYLSSEQENRHPVAVKVVHCQRVRREMILLANELELDERLVALAEIIGLFAADDVHGVPEFGRAAVVGDIAQHADFSE